MLFSILALSSLCGFVTMSAIVCWSCGVVICAVVFWMLRVSFSSCGKSVSLYVVVARVFSFFCKNGMKGGSSPVVVFSVICFCSSSISMVPSL